MRSIAPVFSALSPSTATHVNQERVPPTLPAMNPPNKKRQLPNATQLPFFVGEKKRHETKKTVVSGGMNHPLTASRRQDLSISNNQNITFYVYSLPNSDLVPPLKM